MSTDDAFVEQVIVELYDAEVARHPDGVPAAAVYDAIVAQVAAVLARIDADRSGRP